MRQHPNNLDHAFNPLPFNIFEAQTERKKRPYRLSLTKFEIEKDKEPEKFNFFQTLHCLYDDKYCNDICVITFYMGDFAKVIEISGFFL